MSRNNEDKKRFEILYWKYRTLGLDDGAALLRAKEELAVEPDQADTVPGEELEDENCLDEWVK